MNIPVKNTKKINHLYDNVTSFLGRNLHKAEDKMEDLGLIKKKKTGPGMLIGALAGLAVGAGVALLLAKDTGEDLRKKISKNFDETKVKFLEKKEELTHKKDELVSKTEDKVKAIKKEAHNVKNAAIANNKDFTHQDSNL
jgi:gas vesicle protein